MTFARNDKHGGDAHRRNRRSRRLAHASANRLTAGAAMSQNGSVQPVSMLPRIGGMQINASIPRISQTLSNQRRWLASCTGSTARADNGWRRARVRGTAGGDDIGNTGASSMANLGIRRRRSMSPDGLAD